MPILLNDYLPSNPKSRYVLLQELNVMLPYRFVRFTHACGNNKGNIHFLWKIPMDTSAEELLQMNHSTATCVKSTMDTYTRAMRHEALQSFGRNYDAKPAVLRELYHRLTGDASASATADQAVDDRIRLALDGEDEMGLAYLQLWSSREVWSLLGKVPTVHGLTSGYRC